LVVSIVISIASSEDCEENERGVCSVNLSAVDAAVWNQLTDSLAAEVISSANTAFERHPMAVRTAVLSESRRSFF
jgi:hypothetical protein